LVAPVFVVVLLVLSDLAASPPLAVPLWPEEGVVVVVDEVPPACMLITLVVVFKIETVELIA
jgi:hypothetical protein